MKAGFTHGLFFFSVLSDSAGAADTSRPMMENTLVFLCKCSCVNPVNENVFNEPLQADVLYIQWSKTHFAVALAILWEQNNSTTKYFSGNCSAINYFEGTKWVVECLLDVSTYAKEAELPKEVLPLVTSSENHLCIRCESQMVPRYLYSSTSSTGVPWIEVVTDVASTKLLVGEGHRHLLGFADIQLETSCRFWQNGPGVAFLIDHNSCQL